MTANLSPKRLEQLWIRFQFDIAGVRGVLGPMYQAAVDARRAHTFHVGSQPQTKALRAIMTATPGEPNGVPDGYAIMTGLTYGARVASVSTASVVIMTLDTAIQGFAGQLTAGQGANMLAGDLIFNASGNASERASTLIWATANNARHVDEWFRTAFAYKDPRSKEDIRLREMQNRSMEPLAHVLGCELPITDNVAFEIMQLLSEFAPNQGSYDRIELHALRIGQDLIHRTGLTNAPIGVTIKDALRPEVLVSVAPEDLIVSDGIARTASSLPTTERLAELTPIDDLPVKPPTA